MKQLECIHGHNLAAHGCGYRATPQRDAPTADDLPVVLAAFDAIGDTPPVGLEPRELLPPCRCGWPDETPYGPPPVRVELVDITTWTEDGQIAFETSPNRRACRSCTHPIEERREHVVRRLTRPGAVYARYHIECVEIR